MMRAIPMPEAPLYVERQRPENKVGVAVTSFVANLE